MPGPLLFFIFIIVADLILKSFKDKKKIEQTKEKRQQELQSDVKRKPNYTEVKSNPSRNIMSTLREEIEKERQKEIARRQGRPEVEEIPESKIEDKKISTKIYDDKEYWDKKREQDYIRENNIHQPMDIKATDVEINKNGIKDNIIKGIIFSEILSEPKSIKNQKRSM